MKKYLLLQLCFFGALFAIMIKWYDSVIGWRIMRYIMCFVFFSSICFLLDAGGCC